MFERFTEGARRVVGRAADRAVHEPCVTTEHLLYELLALRGTQGAAVLDRLGVAARRADLERDLDAARRRGGITKADADALAGLGIDVAEVVDRVEAVHGAGALAPPATRRRRRGIPLDGQAKAVLEKSLRIALARGDKHVGDEHMLLALAATPGIAAEVLADHGATYTAIEEAMPASAKSA